MSCLVDCSSAKTGYSSRALVMTLKPAGRNLPRLPGWHCATVRSGTVTAVSTVRHHAMLHESHQLLTTSGCAVSSCSPDALLVLIRGGTTGNASMASLSVAQMHTTDRDVPDQYHALNFSGPNQWRSAGVHCAPVSRGNYSRA